MARNAIQESDMLQIPIPDSKSRKAHFGSYYIVLQTARTEDSNRILKEKIESWLDDEGIPYEEVKEINSHFRLKAQLKNMIIQVHLSKVRLGCIIIQGTMALDADQLDLVGKISEQDRRSLFLAVFSKLDKEEYLFQLSEDYLDPNWLRIQRTLYAEDLTRSELLNQMKELNSKFVNVNYDLYEALDIIPPITNETQVYT